MRPIEQRKDVSQGGKDISDFTCRLSRTLVAIGLRSSPSVDGAAIARRLLDSD